VIRAYVALGSNLGDRAGHLALARRRFAELPGTRVVAASRVEETAPLGGLDQPPYLNKMLALDTELAPRALLAAGRAIEVEAGRDRATAGTGRWESRTLDCDLVLYDELEIREPDLVVPHPGLADRDFWRRELAELRAMGA
jgi:2-amino-4-hydroxy-6-hydroxymethyldihydropteridine diphosphokinase